MVGAGLATALIASGCDPVAQPKEVKAEPTTAKVVRQDLVGYAFFDGKVIAPPGSQASVASPYDVALGEVPVTQGKWVSRGATIATMQMPDLKSSVDAAELNLKSAEAAYAAAKANNEGPVREAERALADARAAERKARQDTQMGVMADLEAATAVRKEAEAAVAAAKAAMNSQVLPEKQSVEIAAEYLRDARAGAKMANIKAPISGTIITLEAKPGLVVKSKQILATIVDLAAIEVQGTVPAALADKVEKGTDVIIAVEGDRTEPIDGEVASVTVLPPAEGQASGGYLAKIEFDNKEGWILPGSTIKRIGVPTGKVEDVLVVPVAAVKTEDGKSVVMVRKGTEWVATTVTTGLTDGALIEIKSGLSEGDEVKVG